MPAQVVADALKVVEVAVRASDLRPRTRLAAARLREKLGGRRPVVLALGKASASMTLGALDSIGGPEGGVVVVPQGAGATVPRGLGLEVVESSHPQPTELSLRAGEALLEWAAAAGRSRTPVVALVSGGGSAMAEVPLDGLSIEDVARLNEVLLKCGANISQINVVRRHVSKVKGGRLALAAMPSDVYGLYASDVPGDRLEDIASGPTAPDPTTYLDALRVIAIFGVSGEIPRRVLEVLEAGARGELPETLKPTDEAARKVSNELVATNYDVLAEVKAELERMGYKTLTLTSMAQGESKDVGRLLASITAESIRRGVPAPPPLAVLLGGETTVTVRGGGRGGRNQELALSWALGAYELGVESERAALVAVATDGIDGPTDAAGAIVTPGSIDKMLSKGLDPWRLLANNDSYRALSAADALIKTGPTGSNLNNVIAVLIR